MEKLRLYLNSLSRQEQEYFAFRCGTTLGYLRKSLSTKPLFDALLCLSVERASNGEVTRQDLRPNDYWRIWPDLPEPKKEVAA
ncbi:MAG: helix-turn-helix domain-containing protein [Methylobacillus sp.]|jgi:DNA-binding transcriptional regulator YdaS (Cro superfamily)|nr:helix-turn-helix domain-containing protein [Methylobacillus sp.]